MYNAIDYSLSDEERKRGEDNRKRGGRDNFTKRQVEETAEQIADWLVRDAEQVKARIFQTPGNEQGMVHSMLIDKRYLLVALHVDRNIKAKTENDEYVDFSRLLPRDKV